MSQREKNARDYCAEIEADPDEMVWGCLSLSHDWVCAPRWSWYIGAIVRIAA